MYVGKGCLFVLYQETHLVHLSARFKKQGEGVYLAEV